MIERIMRLIIPVRGDVDKALYWTRVHKRVDAPTARGNDPLNLQTSCEWCLWRFTRPGDAFYRRLHRAPAPPRSETVLRRPMPAQSGRHSTGAITRIPRSSLGSSGHPLGSAPAFFVASFCHQVISARICALPVFHPWYLWGCGGRPIAGCCECNQHSEPVTRRSRNLPLGTVYFVLTLLPS